MDFTVSAYKQFLETLKNQGLSFLTFSESLTRSVEKRVILRHDVDRLPLNSLAFSKIQAEVGIRGTYYFRAVPGLWDEPVIRQVAGMGHEIGYHYEDISLAIRRLRAQGSGLRANRIKEKELVEVAIDSFVNNLEKLRKIVPVKTICMHGSPHSRWDSRLLWKYYDYHDFGIIGEPYFDIDFDEVLYLTDTGRRWDGSFVAVRDKAQGAGLRAQGGKNEKPYDNWKVRPVKYRIKSEMSDEAQNSGIDQLGTRNLEPVTFYKFHSTLDIIKAADEGNLPNKIMMTFHPQRWTDKPLPWVRELVWQNVKNVVKYFVMKMR